VSGFTPRSWKSQAEPQAEQRSASSPAEHSPARADVKTNNLPMAATAIIGRERDVAEVKALLDQHRLVTLVGSGGIGKTRLAVQVGSELLESSPDGVWLVELASIADPELVSSVIAQTLGMNQQEGHRVDEAIPHWLERKNLLLIFDNCEHVLETIAPIAAAIVRAAPHVRILATSRQGLEIAGEKLVRVPSLDVPRAIADLGADKVIAFAAVALFVARATLVDTSFALTDDTAPIVADICRRLDGIPLAIELAAARVKVLSIPHLAERLNERFKLLTSSSRDVLPRQKTLHALIDWSYDLLTEQEQTLFARLGIFAGGFALDAATHVCGGEGLDELDILDLLGSLTDKSLIVADTTGEHERYRLLESTAAYALEKLRASGEHTALARRHAEYYREQAEAAHERSGIDSAPLELVTALELELENFRSALVWTLTQDNDTVLGGRIAGALGALWSGGGLAVEGRYWIERALHGVSETDHPHVAARLRFALVSFLSGKRKRDEGERAMQLYAAAGDQRGAARAQREVAFALYQMGELDAAWEANQQALAALRACDDNYVADALNVRALIAWSLGDVDAAREDFAQVLTTYRAMRDESGEAMVLGNVAELEFFCGNPDEALRAVNNSLDINLRGRNSSYIATSYLNGAAYRLALDDLPGALQYAREGLRAARQVRNELGIAIALQHYALLAALAKEGRRAAQLLGYANARYDDLENRRENTEQWGYDRLLATLRATMSEDEIAQLLAEGATWPEDRAVEEALLVAIDSTKT
jgi:predicted ATPase